MIFLLRTEKSAIKETNSRVSYKRVIFVNFLVSTAKSQKSQSIYILSIQIDPKGPQLQCNNIKLFFLESHNKMLYGY